MFLLRILCTIMPQTIPFLTLTLIRTCMNSPPLGMNKGEIGCEWQAITNEWWWATTSEWHLLGDLRIFKVLLYKHKIGEIPISKKIYLLQQVYCTCVYHHVHVCTDGPFENSLAQNQHYLLPLTFLDHFLEFKEMQHLVVSEGWWIY